MKNILFLLLLLGATYSSYAQSKIEKQFPHSSSKPIKFNFDDINVVNVSGWQNDYISVVATVNINNNTQNDAFKISENGEVIEGIIADKHKLPQIIRIKKGDEIFTFHTDNWNSPEIKKFYAENGYEGISWKSHGILWDITVNIKIPESAHIQINSKHGVIELQNLTGKVEANSVHGGVDLSVNNRMNGSLHAQTKWGTIYSNIDLEIDKANSTVRDWNKVSARIKDGVSLSSFKLESKHSNIYLRKSL